MLSTLSQRHWEIVDRFVAACQSDERVVAAFLGGSYARGTADGDSDLDLYAVTADGTYSDFFAGRTAFMRQLGEPMFLENFDEYGFDLLLFVMSDGTEGELGLGRESGFQHIHGGPYVILVDKTGILAGVSFPEHGPSPAAQVERLYRLVHWFWHDLSHHFLTAIARDRLWTAVGALEDLRRTCVDLARLAADFNTAEEGYEKVETVLPMSQLAALEMTFCPPERGALLQAARDIVDFYRELAPSLARAHDITYPAELERVVCARLDALSGTSA